MLRLIGEGLTNRQIGVRMGLAEKTVKNYTSHLLAKLGLERRTQAAILATELRDRAGDERGSDRVAAAMPRRAATQHTSVPDGAGPDAEPAAAPLGAVGEVGQPAAHGHRRQPAAVVGDGHADLLARASR